MELILATPDGREIGVLTYDFDIQIGDENTFEITMPSACWNSNISFGSLVYVPGTEYGGIVKDIATSTSEDKIYVRGYTWRGYLVHRIIEPPSGQDYMIVSGELNTVMNSVLANSLGSLFRVSSASTGVSVTSYQFARYVDFVTGISAMLGTKSYRLQIEYKQTDTSGYVEISAVPIVNYGDEISQDYRLNFAMDDDRTGINHLICLGQGELRDRTVVHLYANTSGVISQTKTQTGINEIVDVYDNTAAEDATALIEAGTAHFIDLLSTKTFKVTFDSTDDVNIGVGDTVTGRDYITSNTITKPITRKIISRSNGVEKIEYKVEGEN